jgi:mannose-1-phosphate guanylyltransferase/phosphomannomutase
MVTTVILAGGEGSRFKTVDPNIPKCLYIVENKTLLSRILHDLKFYKLNSIKIFTRLNHREIELYINQNHKELNIEVLQEINKRGTGSGLIEHIEKLEETILIIMGDLVMNIDLQKVLNHHFHSNSKITLLCHPSSHMEDSDIVLIDAKNNVIGIEKKNSINQIVHQNITMAGVIVLQKEILSEILIGETLKKENIDLTNDIVIKSLLKKVPISAYLTSEYIKDAGTPTRAKEVIEDFKRNYVLLNKNMKRPLVILDRDGTINELKGHIVSENEIVIKPGVSESIRKLNDAGILVAVITNQPVLARGDCDEDKLKSIHSHLEYVINKQSGGYFDEILYCPHYPESGFPGEVPALKKACFCRKPGVKLYEDVINKFDPNLNLIFAVGDSQSDIEAGNKIGAKTYLISKTTRKDNDKADFHVPDLEKAVDLIIGEVFK